MKRAFKRWHQVQLIYFVAWAAYKTWRLFFPKNGVLTPNAMKIWSQFAYIDSPAVAKAFWEDVPWTWDES